jgi:hypothetical protein
MCDHPLASSMVLWREKDYPRGSWSDVDIESIVSSECELHTELFAEIEPDVLDSVVVMCAIRESTLWIQYSRTQSVKLHGRRPDAGSHLTITTNSHLCLHLCFTVPPRREPFDEKMNSDMVESFEHQPNSLLSFLLQQSTVG